MSVLLPHRELTKMETSAHHQSNLTAASEDQKHRTGVSAEGGSDERDPARTIIEGSMYDRNAYM
jgi:hypothetical protein